MTMRIFALTAALLATATVPAVAATATTAAATGDCKPFTEAQVKERFDRWNASLASGTADAVTLWYTPDAKVHLALKDRPATDPAALRAFYEGAMIKGLKAEVQDRKIEVGCNTAVDAGKLTYTLGRDQIAANYRKVYENRDGVWLIREHVSTRVQ